MTESKIAIVVDDEPGVLDKHSSIMEKAGFTVVQFKNTDLALEHMGYDSGTGKVTQNIPSVVVTDHETGMLHYPGTVLIEALEGTSVGRVLVSGANVGERIKSPAMFVSKPVSEDSLLFAVKKIDGRCNA